MKISRDKIYLDYAATTPIDKEVKKHGAKRIRESGSLHSWTAQQQLTNREKIASNRGLEIIYRTRPRRQFEVARHNKISNQISKLKFLGIIRSLLNKSF